jgi:uncharacterized protein (TIGR03083 family)
LPWRGALPSRAGPYTASVEIAEHIAALRAEGERLADAAERADLDEPVPTTPEWRMRDLVRHIGDVHRWARTHVAEGRMLPIGRDELTEIAGPLPKDGDLLDWFREGHDRLVRTLEAADPQIQCWSFLPAPSPLAFWARRQAHETGIHRADAQTPTGRITPFSSEVAVDGIDELLLGFFAGKTDDPAAPSGQTLYVRPTDAEAGWLAFMNDRSLRHDNQYPGADCSVRGTASDLYLLLWNRRGTDGLDIDGDRSVLDVWRSNAQIHWSRGR